LSKDEILNNKEQILNLMEQYKVKFKETTGDACNSSQFEEMIKKLDEGDSTLALSALFSLQTKKFEIEKENILNENRNSIDVSDDFLSSVSTIFLHLKSNAEKIKKQAEASGILSRVSKGKDHGFIFSEKLKSLNAKALKENTGAKEAFENVFSKQDLFGQNKDTQDLVFRALGLSLDFDLEKCEKGARTNIKNILETSFHANPVRKEEYKGNVKKLQDFSTVAAQFKHLVNQNKDTSDNPLGSIVGDLLCKVICEEVVAKVQPLLKDKIDNKSTFYGERSEKEEDRTDYYYNDMRTALAGVFYTLSQVYSHVEPRLLEIKDLSLTEKDGKINLKKLKMMSIYYLNQSHEFLSLANKKSEPLEKNLISRIFELGSSYDANSAYKSMEKISNGSKSYILNTILEKPRDTVRPNQQVDTKKFVSIGYVYGK